MKLFGFFKANVPVILLSLFSINALIRTVGVGDTIVMVALMVLLSFYHYLESKKEEPINKEFKKDLEAIRETLKEQTNKFEALKLSNTFRR